jgi:hypothetical protein
MNIHKKKRTTERCSSAGHFSSTVAILTTEPTSVHVHARLLPTQS